MTGRLALRLAAAGLLGITTAASAQTVILRHAPAGSTLEVVIDGTSAGTAPVAAADGNATVTAPGTTALMTEANVWVDVCGDRNRVIVHSRGMDPLPAEAACRRTQIGGLFLVQRITTMVVDIRPTPPTMLIRQGPAFDTWLRDPLPGATRTETLIPPVVGLTLFGAVGQSWSFDFEQQACGSVSCPDRQRPWPLTGGVAWWLKDWLAVDARYAYFGNQSLGGSGDTFEFSTSREGGMAAFTGRLGKQVGRVRPFGRAGFALHRETTTTSQTVDGTIQRYQLQTDGWSPVYGGGLEFWLSPRLGFYGEGQGMQLKGDDMADTPTPLQTSDVVVTFHIGVTLRVP